MSKAEDRTAPASSSKLPETRYRAPALEKGLDILELLASEPAPLALPSICKRLERTQGELFRMFHVLEARGFIGQDPSNEGYVLTDQVLSMAMQQPSYQNIVEVAIPIMRALSLETRQSCHLALRSRNEIAIVARMESPEHLGFTVREGYRKSILDSVSGLVLFAFQPKDIRASWIQMLKPAPSKTQIKALLDEADNAVRRGYVLRSSRYVEGITDVSAPIFRGQRTAAALTTIFLRRQPQQGSASDVAKKLLIAAGKISDSMPGGDDSP